MKETIDLGKFPFGMNNVAPDTDLPDGSLVSAINVDLDKDGNFSRRDGSLKIYSGKNTHSLFQRYFVEGSKLKYLNEDYSASDIATGLDFDKYLAYCTVFDDVYYSDGTKNSIIDKGHLGIPTPSSNPILTETTGRLNAGTYQVAICFKDSVSGEIGGAGPASLISVREGGGIILSNIVVSPDGYDVLIFVSTQNGAELYQNGTVPNGLTDYSIINSRKSTGILNTQFMQPLPGGHIIKHFQARLYIARDNILWFSQAFRYGLHKPSSDFFQFPAKISIVLPVMDGIYVVADKSYFLSGTEPKQMNKTVVSEDSAIEGTGVVLGGASFGLEGNIDIAYWFSNKGAVLGMPGGVLKQLTEDRLSISEAYYGTTMLKEQNGIRQAITALSTKDSTSGFAFGAQATSAIYRNGVLVP